MIVQAIFKRLFYSNTFWSLLLNLVLIGGLAVAFIYLIFNYYLPQTTRHGESISVPRLIGQPITNGLNLLSDLELKPIITDTLYNERYAEGTIIRQNPPYKQGVKYGRKIYLVVSTQQAQTIQVPNILHQSLKNAELMLLAKGLELGERTYIKDMARDVVLKVIINGSKFEDYGTLAAHGIKKGDTVDVVLGDGLKKELLTMPSLIGLAVDEAEYELEKLGLTYSGEFVAPTSPLQNIGEVIGQTPKAGHIIKMAAAIQLKIVQNDSINAYQPNDST